MNVRAKIITKSGEWGGGSRNRHDMDRLGHMQALLGSIKGSIEVSFEKNRIYPFGVLLGKNNLLGKRKARELRILST